MSLSLLVVSLLPGCYRSCEFDHCLISSKYLTGRKEAHRSSNGMKRNSKAAQPFPRLMMLGLLFLECRFLLFNSFNIILDANGEGKIYEWTLVGVVLFIFYYI